MERRRKGIGGTDKQTFSDMEKNIQSGEILTASYTGVSVINIEHVSDLHETKHNYSLAHVNKYIAVCLWECLTILNQQVLNRVMAER